MAIISDAQRTPDGRLKMTPQPEDTSAPTYTSAEIKAGKVTDGWEKYRSDGRAIDDSDMPPVTEKARDPPNEEGYRQKLVDKVYKLGRGTNIEELRKHLKGKRNRVVHAVTELSVRFSDWISYLRNESSAVERYLSEHNGELPKILRYQAPSHLSLEVYAIPKILVGDRAHFIPLKIQEKRN